jgi:hypothetical protein
MFGFVVTNDTVTRNDDDNDDNGAFYHDCWYEGVILIWMYTILIMKSLQHTRMCFFNYESPTPLP